MTCIVAFNDGKTLWMGGDSSSYGDGVNQIISSKKVFNKNGFTIGYTTSFRMGQILEHYWPDIYIDPALELESEIVTKVVPAIRKVLKEHGY